MKQSISSKNIFQKQKKNKELTRNPEFYVKNIPTQNKILTPKSFLAKKICRFKVEKFDDYFENELKGPYEGRWTLKEHILFLQAIDRYGMNWKNIKKTIKTRTAYLHKKDQFYGICFILH